MATQPTAFGVMLKRYRGRAGLTQEHLAERANLSTVAINKLERGERRTPRTDTVAMLAVALGLSLEEQDEFERAARASARADGIATSAPASIPPHVNAFLRAISELHARQATLIELLVATDRGGGIRQHPAP